MVSLAHLHFITFFIILINILVFNKNILNNLGSKYFFINYIYHNYKGISCFIITYPFIIILFYFIIKDIFLISSFFIAILHINFLYELISTKNINKRDAYLTWYIKNVKHSFSMHAYDMIKKDYSFLEVKRNSFALFKFEIIFFISLVIESEVLSEIFMILESIKYSS